ncbi:MAG: hypothetical protein HYV97_17355 [Bdellovibrio sp.]|nr:hypothetical protein [Bdellovibrio sp.]
MKKLTLIIILTLLITPSYGATTRNQASLGHIFAATGALYGLGSVRLGHHTWEGGLVNSNSLGIVKLLNIGSLYFGFGFVAVGGTELGFYASTGVEFWNFSIINFRAEANATTSYKNTAQGELLLGLSCNF